MSAHIIRDDNTRRIIVGDKWIRIEDLIDDRVLGAALTPEQRKAMADALDPERANLAHEVEQLSAARRREAEKFGQVRDDLLDQIRTLTRRAETAEAKVRELEALRMIDETAGYTATRSEDGSWRVGDEWYGRPDTTAEMHREQRDLALAAAAKHEAVARAIEAEQAADPVEALADEFAQTLAGDMNIGGSWSMDPTDWRDITLTLARRAHAVLGDQPTTDQQ